MKELGDVGLAPYFQLKRTDDRRWFLHDWKQTAVCSGMPFETAYQFTQRAKEGRPR